MQTLEDNSILDGLLSDLVLPAIYQKQPVWRERGMTLLGLMCLISKVQHREELSGIFR